jgi:hypothetical protein
MRLQLLKGLAVSMACWGLLCPAGLMAADKAPAKTTANKVAAVQGDIALSKGGTLIGQVVDGQGRALDGAAVSINKDGKEIARTVTSKDGNFSVTGLRGGTYELTAGQTKGVYRLWSEKVAPPAAKAQALLVSSNQTIRGQGYLGPDIVTVSTLATGITGVTLGAISLSKINDVQKQVDKIPTSP